LGHANIDDCVALIDACDSAVERVECAALNRHSCSGGITGVCGACKPGFDATIEGPANLLCTALSVVECGMSPECGSLHRLECKSVENTCGDCEAGFFGTSGNSNGRCTPEAERGDCVDADAGFCGNLNRLPCSSVPNVCGPCQPGYFTQISEAVLNEATDFDGWDNIAEHPTVVASSQTYSNAQCFAAGDLVHSCARTPDVFCNELNRRPCDGLEPNTCGGCLEEHESEDGLDAPNSLCTKIGVDCSNALSVQACDILHRTACSTNDNECGECQDGFVANSGGGSGEGCVLDPFHCSPAHCNFGGVCVLADSSSGTADGGGGFFCVCDPSLVDVGDDQCVLERTNAVTEWVASAWSFCTKDCDGGVRTRQVTCQLVSPDGEITEDVDTGLCDAGDKPVELQVCGLVECGQTQAEVHLAIFPPEFAYSQLAASAAVADAFEMSVIQEIAEALGVPPARFAVHQVYELQPSGIGIDLMVLHQSSGDGTAPSVEDVLLLLIMQLSDSSSALRTDGQWFVYVDRYATSFDTFETGSVANVGNPGGDGPGSQGSDSEQSGTPLIVGATFGVCAAAVLTGLFAMKKCRKEEHTDGGMEVVCAKEMTDMKTIEAYAVTTTQPHNNEDTYFDGEVVASAYPLDSSGKGEHNEKREFFEHQEASSSSVNYSPASSKLSSNEMAMRAFNAAVKDVGDAVKYDHEQNLFEAKQCYSRAILHFNDYILHETDETKLAQVSLKVEQYKSRSAVIQQCLGECDPMEISVDMAQNGDCMNAGQTIPTHPSPPHESSSSEVRKNDLSRPRQFRTVVEGRTWGGNVFVAILLSFHDPLGHVDRSPCQETCVKGSDVIRKNISRVGCDGK
jgi:hypothetical protein